MKNTISANELKTRGVSAIAEVTRHNTEAIITVHGKNTYVVLSMEEYNKLRECELETAIQEVREDIRNGNLSNESIDEHIRRITGV